MKKKLIFGLIFLLLTFGFLEAQYHFFLRANRYWSNAGVFSTDNRIQSVGSNNALRVAYSPSVYREFTIDSDAIIDLDGPMLLNYAPTGTSGYNLIEIDYDVEGIVTGSARGIYAHVTNRSDTAITGELTGGEFKVRSQDSDTTSVKGIHVSIDAKANTITTGRGIEISIDAGESEHGGITTAQGLRIAHNSSGAHTTITGIVIEGPGTWTYGIDLNSGTTTTDLRLSNGALIHNTSSDILTITEATTAIVGKQTITNATLGATGRGLYITSTIDTPGATDGGAFYADTNLTGIQTGNHKVAGVWTNLGADFQGSQWIFVMDLGIYDGSTNGCDGALAILNMDFQIASGSSPSLSAFIRTNVNPAGSLPDYFIYAANDEAGCFTGGSPGTTFAGYMKIRIGETIYAIPLVSLGGI